MSSQRFSLLGGGAEFLGVLGAMPRLLSLALLAVASADLDLANWMGQLAPILGLPSRKSGWGLGFGVWGLGFIGFRV